MSQDSAPGTVVPFCFLGGGPRGNRTDILARVLRRLAVFLPMCECTAPCASSFMMAEDDPSAVREFAPIQHMSRSRKDGGYSLRKDMETAEVCRVPMESNRTAPGVVDHEPLFQDAVHAAAGCPGILWLCRSSRPSGLSLTADSCSEGHVPRTSMPTAKESSPP